VELSGIQSLIFISLQVAQAALDLASSIYGRQHFKYALVELAYACLMLLRDSIAIVGSVSFSSYMLTVQSHVSMLESRDILEDWFGSSNLFVAELADRFAYVFEYF
jgi:hypothetical protein